MQGRRFLMAIGLVLVLCSFIGLGLVRTIETRRLNAALAQAKRNLAEGRRNSARRQLLALAARWPDHSEVQYQLGLSEQACGRPEAAADAWARVSPESPLAGLADVNRAKVEMRRGRFSDSEDLMIRSLRREGEHTVEALWGLVLLYRFQGRFDEARRVLREGYPGSSDKVGVLIGLHKIDTEAEPITALTHYLENAGSNAPDDDRVWLAKAGLALRMGRMADADRWLTACQKRRPEDAAVWRTRLDWALANDDPGAVRVALGRIPAKSDPDVDPSIPVLTVRAWRAARLGNRAEERRALEQLDEIKPGDVKVLDRLAELALASGESQEAEQYRRRTWEIAQGKEAYKQLISSRAPLKQASELSRLAMRLGRRFEANCWSSLAGESRPTVSEVERRSAGGQSTGEKDGSRPTTKTLADLLPEITQESDPTPSVSASRSAASGTPPRFEDDATSAGLEFLQESGRASGRPLPPVTMSGGVGLLDYDGDGWLDVYLVQGGQFPPDPQTPSTGDRLFRNLGAGRFEDVTASCGIGQMPKGYGHGVAVGDYDGDGYPDLFVTRWRSYALYHNRGDGRFEDATARAGLGGNRDWPTSAVFADLDNDGDLDLYVCHYFEWDPDDPNACRGHDAEDGDFCNPRDFTALPDHVFRNDGGRFTDVTPTAGIVDRDGRGLGVIAADLDDDNLIDLYVANDMTANYQFRNLGGFRFEETAFTSGSATNGSGGAQAGMGVACGDLDGDGRPDLAVTNFYNESTTFFQNLGDGIFADHTDAIGLAAPSRFMLGFGISMSDVNNDGRIDLFTANGHVFDRRPRYPWTMTAQLLLGVAGGRVEDFSARAGPPFQSEHLGRGLAAGDLDNDGWTDFLLISLNEPLVFFHNRSTGGGHSITFRLEGRSSNRDGVGARVSVDAGGHRQTAQRSGVGSYQSADDPRLHFGIGDAACVDSIEVRWPSGQRDRFTNLSADTGYLLREGESQAVRLKGWEAPPLVARPTTQK
jgi:predicted Zn-dependent protease